MAGPEGLCWEYGEDGPVLTDFGKKALMGEDVEVPGEWGIRIGPFQVAVNRILHDKLLSFCVAGSTVIFRGGPDNRNQQRDGSSHSGSAFAGKAAGSPIGPVSYTHLDVYKRQALFAATYRNAESIIGRLTETVLAVTGTSYYHNNRCV